MAGSDESQKRRDRGDRPEGGESQPEDGAASEEREERETEGGEAPVHRAAEPCVVVGVGASAGGLNAFRDLLKAIPEDSGLAYVFVLHLDPQHDSLMAELLDRHTSLPVIEANDGTVIEPDHVYLIPPNRFIEVNESRLTLVQPVESKGLRLPIDHLFSSLARERKERSICIVLTGTGSDGSVGVRDIKAAGGMTMAQDPKDAEYNGMPRAAIDTGCIDRVLPIDQMPAAFLQFATHPYIDSGEKPLLDADDETFRSVLALLTARADYDFSSYKRGTLVRRIQRRMGLNQIDEIDAYLGRLRSDDEEVEALFADLLIGVTRFFREPETWQALAEKVAPALVRDHDASQPLRVWVPGCSTGEEAFTVACVLEAEIEDQNRRDVELLVFATDLDEKAIERARAGTYAPAAVADVPDRYRRRFFEAHDDVYMVKRALRERVVFAVQNVITDPPFSKLALITCRNLLIYLENRVQRKLMEVFHFALSPRGFLLLGDSETVGEPGLFEPVSRQHRLYQKVGRGAGLAPRRTLNRRLNDGTSEEEEPDAPRPLEVPERVTQLLLDRFSPAAVAIDSRLRIRYLHGATSRYLSFPSGEPTLDVMSMVLPGLGSRLRASIRRAIEEGEPVIARATRVQRGDDTVSVEMRVEQLKRGSDTVLVTFKDVDSSEPAVDDEIAEEDQPIVDHLRVELQTAREDYQTTVEELETSNEELKASNEEVMSMNEELQSTNEELETSREELQSLNEELSTINSQLEDKIQEVEAANDDLGNLLTSSRIATLFLDSELQIRRFTPAAAELFRLRDADVGRPMSDLQYVIRDDDLTTEAQTVLDRLEVIESSVETREGRAFRRTVLPYRTSRNRIDGVVVTYTDVTDLTDSNRRLERREAQARSLARLSQTAMATTELEPVFEQAVALLRRRLRADFAKVLQLQPGGEGFRMRAGEGWSAEMVGDGKVPSGLDSQAGFTLYSKSPVVVEDLGDEDRFSGPALLRDHGVRSGISVVIGSTDDPWGVLGVHSEETTNFEPEDVSFVESVAFVLSSAVRRRRALDELANSERDQKLRLAELEAVYDEAPVGLAVHDPDLRILRINEHLARINGVSAAESVGRTLAEIAPAIAENVEPLLSQVLESGEPIDDTEITAPLGEGGEDRHFRTNYRPLTDADGGAIGVVAVVHDVTEERQSARRMEVRYGVADALASSGDLASILEDLLVRVAKPLRFDIGEIWLWDPEDESFKCRVFKAPDEAGHEEALKHAYDHVPLNLGEGLVGQAWQGREIVWFENLPEHPEFVRRDRAKALGMQSAVAFPLTLGDGEVQGVMAFHTRRRQAEDARLNELFTDVGNNTAQFVRRQQAEALLQRRELTTRAFLENAPVPILVSGERGEVLFANPEFYQATGFAADEIHTLSDFVEDWEPSDLDATAESSAYETREMTVTTRTGRRRWLLYEAPAGSGELTGVRTVVGLDITERHESEERMQEAFDTAVEDSEAKSLFLASFSHEIRTPLTAILGHTDMLLRAPVPQPIKGSLLTIQRNGHHLLQMLSNVLDMSRIESGHIELAVEPKSAVELVRDVVAMLAGEAEEAGLELRAEFVSSVPELLPLDGLRVRQILLNLVGNGIKYTSEGTVSLLVRHEVDGDVSELVFDIVDTGDGLPSEELERLLDPFEVGSGPQRHGLRGVGLGLSIAHQLTQLLGGDLGVQSEEGKGTRFTVRLPAAAAASIGSLTTREANEALSVPGPEVDIEWTRLDGLRVVVADDDDDVRGLLMKELVASGAACQEAADGAAALEIFENSEEPIDAFLLDLGMPHVSGPEVARQLRARGYAGRIIALTAHVTLEDRDRCLEAGCDAFLTKPLRLPDLQKHLVAERAQRVLIVEDDHDTRQLLRVMLEREGYAVRGAASVERAIELGRDWLPDTVVADAKLGGESGLVLPARFAESGQRPRFLMLTGWSTTDLRPQAEAAGYETIVMKPVDIERLLDLLGGPTGTPPRDRSQ